MFGFGKKKPAPIAFDPARQTPAVRKSICTGEMTVGFVDRETGRFSEHMRVDGQEGLEQFCREIGVKPEDVRVIW